MAKPALNKNGNPNKAARQQYQNSFKPGSTVTPAQRSKMIGTPKKPLNKPAPLPARYRNVGNQEPTGNKRGDKVSPAALKKQVAAYKKRTTTPAKTGTSTRRVK